MNVTFLVEDVGFVELCNFFIINSPDFSTAFLPSLSPARSIPDFIAFLARGFNNICEVALNIFFAGLKVLSTINPLPLC